MTGFWVRLHPILFFHRDIRDLQKYDIFRGKQAALFISLLGKGLTQEINGDGGSIWWAPAIIMDHFGLRQSSNKLTITSNARYRKHLKPFANSFEHYKIKEHSRNSSGVLSETFDHYHWLLRLASIFI